MVATPLCVWMNNDRWQMTNNKQLLYVYEQQQLLPWEGGFHVYVFFSISIYSTNKYLQVDYMYGWWWWTMATAAVRANPFGKGFCVFFFFFSFISLCLWTITTIRPHAHIFHLDTPTSQQWLFYQLLNDKLSGVLLQIDHRFNNDKWQTILTHIVAHLDHSYYHMWRTMQDQSGPSAHPDC